MNDPVVSSLTVFLLCVHVSLWTVQWHRIDFHHNLCVINRPMFYHPTPERKKEFIDYQYNITYNNTACTEHIVQVEINPNQFLVRPCVQWDLTMSNNAPPRSLVNYTRGSTYNLVANLPRSPEALLANSATIFSYKLMSVQWSFKWRSQNHGGGSY